MIWLNPSHSRHGRLGRNPLVIENWCDQASIRSLHLNNLTYKRHGLNSTQVKALMLPWVEVSAILNFRIAITVWWAIFKYGISQWMWSDLHIVSPVYELTSCFHDCIWLIVVFFLNDSVNMILVRKADASSLLCTDAFVESKNSAQQCCQGDYLKMQGFFIVVLAQRCEMHQWGLGQLCIEKKEDRCLNNFV